MRFDPEAWKRHAREDFDAAWHEGSSVITPPGYGGTYPRYTYRRASPHPIAETIESLRQVYLSMGFDEARVPLIIEEKDVYRQFGPEASAVLDRVFYLGGLPRPNVGIARAQVDAIGSLLERALSRQEEDDLRETLHAYKKSLIDGDELTHEIARVLSCDDGLVVRILDDVFPEFKNLVPESSRMTLRSHMTSGWFLSLAALWEHAPVPLRLFSVDRCFRREQEEGPTRLMCYHSASCVVAGEDITLEEGKAVSEALLSAFGFTDFRFRPDEKRSKYYIPDTQTEVYARHPVHDWVEVATFGMYSPSALGEYGIGIPVMNLGLGVERLAMIRYGSDDIRRLTMPQFFPGTLSDREIARAVTLREEPATPAGRRCARAVADAATMHAAEPGPCSFPAWEGILCGTPVRVVVEEPESGSKLCGPATFNDIYAYRGAVLGVPDTEKFREVREHGVPTGIRYLDAAAHLAAARIEEAARCGTGTTVQTKMVKLPSEINVKIPDYVMRFMTDRSIRVDVRGPVFLTVRSEIDREQDPESTVI
ncbi:MAG: O-phosphoserine--tRNA ligase [Methanomicrobiales archaeon]|nr:O-phosphoserine--tRNA ligase [Methanomicrobiales archaeon]